MFLGKSYGIFAAVWRGGGVPQHEKDAALKVLYKKKYRIECDSHRGTPLAHAGKAPHSNRGPLQWLLRTGRHSAGGILCLWTPALGGRYAVRSTTPAGTGEQRYPLFMGLSTSPKRITPSTEPSCFPSSLGHATTMLAVISLFLDGMRACVRPGMASDRLCWT